jgi:hypothetical protein
MSNAAAPESVESSLGIEPTPQCVHLRQAPVPRAGSVFERQLKDLNGLAGQSPGWGPVHDRYARPDRPRLLPHRNTSLLL